MDPPYVTPQWNVDPLAERGHRRSPLFWASHLTKKFYYNSVFPSIVVILRRRGDCRDNGGPPMAMDWQLVEGTFVVEAT